MGDGGFMGQRFWPSEIVNGISGWVEIFGVDREPVLWLNVNLQDAGRQKRKGLPEWSRAW
jgi:hypothetical protein